MRNGEPAEGLARVGSDELGVGEGKLNMPLGVRMCMHRCEGRDVAFQEYETYFEISVHLVVGG